MVKTSVSMIKNFQKIAILLYGTESLTAQERFTVRQAIYNKTDAG